MEEQIGIKRSILSASQMPSEFVAIMKIAIGILGITVTVFMVYLSLRQAWLLVVASNRPPPMQQTVAAQNAQGVEVNGIASGSTDRNSESTNSSTDDASNLGTRATSPVVIQEMVQSSVQALQLASQLTLSG